MAMTQHFSCPNICTPLLSLFFLPRLEIPNSFLEGARKLIRVKVFNYHFIGFEEVRDQIYPVLYSDIPIYSE